VFATVFPLLIAAAVALQFWSVRIAKDAIKKGEVKSVGGLPARVFGMPTNGAIWYALKKRAAEGNREAILVRRLGWITGFLLLILYFWPKAT
jgi:hypothetical protein